MMDRVRMFTATAVIGLCLALGAWASPAPARGKGLPQSTFVVGLPQSTFSVDCTCDPCTCAPNTCTCPECAVGCGKKRASQSQSNTAAMQAILMDANYGVGANYQPVMVAQSLPQNQFVAVAPPPTIADTEETEADDTCPCCGMRMTKKQAAKAKQKLATLKPATTANPYPGVIDPNVVAPPATVTYVNPLPTAQPVTYYTAPQGYYTQSCGAGSSCASGTCAGGNCGTGRVGLFGRRR